MAKGKYVSSLENQVAGFTKPNGEESLQDNANEKKNKDATKAKQQKSIESDRISKSAKNSPILSEIREEGFDMDDLDLCRQTYYCTYEEICALKKISYDEMIGVSELVRDILDEGLERRYPGIFKEVESQVVLYKSRKVKRNQRKNK